MKINSGMEIPADGIVIEGSDLTCDESAMTGESLAITKEIYKKCIEKRNELNSEKEKCGNHDVPSPVALAGSTVLTGVGRMLVIAVGKRSTLGKIQSLLQAQEDVKTPLQIKLVQIADVIFLI